MPVFDFSSIPENEKKQDPVCTYTMFRSNEAAASPEKPILILDNSSEQWKHHAIGVFGNQNKRTNFEFREEGSSAYADILQIDARFVSLVRWLGENHINLIRRGCDRLQHFTFITYRMSGSSGLLAIDVKRDLLVMRIAFYVDRCICIIYKLKIFAGALRDRCICGRIHIAYDHGMIITFRYFQLRK